MVLLIAIKLPRLTNSLTHLPIKQNPEQNIPQNIFIFPEQTTALNHPLSHRQTVPKE